MTVKRFPGYVFSQAQHAGTVAAHNHLALTNPAGSGKLIIAGGVFISSVIVGDIVTTAEPMRGWFATGVGGGTVEDVDAIGKVKSTLPDPAGVIRTDTVAITGTLGAAWFNSPPLIGASKGSAPFVHQIPTTIPGSDTISLLPGESIVLRTEAGDVDQRWNLSIAWVEVG